MNGSYSLKSVLPVLVPEMTYEGLEISDGAMAPEAYFTMGEISDPAELAKLRKALLEYCGQDTLGLVRLLEKLRAMAAADAKGQEALGKDILTCPLRQIRCLYQRWVLVKEDCPAWLE
jgi:hypothetical protein